jgi:hypothetical protein
MFVRTAKGEVSMRTPGRMAIDEKRVMLLIDGMSTLENIHKKLPPSLQGQLDTVVVSLFKSNYIEEQHNRRSIARQDSPEQIRLEYRAQKAELQEVIESSQQVNADLLALAESEIFQRIELEEKLEVAQANLIAAETQLAEAHLHYAQLEQTLRERIEALEIQLAIPPHSPAPEIVEITGIASLPVPDADEVVASEQTDAAMDIAMVTEVAEMPDLLPVSPHFAKLAELSFFNGFSETELTQLARVCTWHDMTADTTLVAENEPNSTFYVLVTGRLRRMKHNRTISFLQAGECFGEIAYLRNKTFPAIESIISRTDGLLLSLDTAAFEHIPSALRLHLAEAFMRTQTRRMNETLSNFLV